MSIRLIHNTLFKNIKQLSLVLFLLFASTFSSVSAKEMAIEAVSYRNHVLSIKHDSFGDIKFKKRIYADPARLVFDIFDAKLGSSQTFRYDNITGDISSVRVAQFEANTVRIVCEAKNTTALEKIKIENIGQTLYFKFQINY